MSIDHRTLLLFFWQDVNVALENALNVSNNLIIVGDINEDQLNVNNHHLNNIQLLNNMTNVISEPTRVTAATSSRIGPILISQHCDPLHSGVMDIPESISDHKATFIYIPFTSICSLAYKRKVWFYKRANFESLNKMISRQDWNLINSLSVDEACDIFTTKIIDFCHACIPSKELTIRPNDKPWFDSQLKSLSRRRDRQKVKAIKSKNQNDWTKYKVFRNKVNNMKKKKHAKENYFNNLETVITDSNKSNPKLYWKIFKQLIKSNKNSETIPTLKTVINGQEKYSFTDQEKSNCLNDYFASVSTVHDSKAIIMPLYKKGPKELSSNYRPISLLSCIGKLKERLIYKHIYNHLISNNLIYEKQSGFLTGHSTVYHFIDIFHQVCQGIDTKSYTCMIFCDISKAFDRVWNRGLLFKLKQNGIHGCLIDWIDRTQNVFIGSFMSNPKNTSAGVPQGSVLGPLFFFFF